MIEVILLIVLAVVWIIFASVQDFKHREIANWVSYSLIIFALGFRFFYSLFQENNFMFFYQGLIGFGIFLILGNVFYYSKVFAGGDAKLMISLGAILGFSSSFFVNLSYYVWFVLIYLFMGSFYGVGWSFYLAFKNFKNFKKEFILQFKKNKLLAFLSPLFGIIVLLFSFYETFLLFIGLLIVFLPFFYFFVKSVDESCMVKNVKPSNLTEGDWLYNDITVGKKLIKAKWEGLNLKEINLLKKKRFVKIRYGIPFAPVFLISFVVFCVLFFLDKLYFLWNPFW